MKIHIALNKKQTTTSNLGKEDERNGKLNLFFVGCQ